MTVDDENRIPDGWSACAVGSFEKELAREIATNFEHPLRGVTVTTVAKSEYNDDVLFALLNHKHKLAMVHLTWNVEHRRDWPSVTFYDSWDEWLKDPELKEHA